MPQQTEGPATPYAADPMSVPQVIAPRVLILSSKYDLTCDYVVAALRRRAVRYARIATEELPAASVTLDPVARRLELRSAGLTLEVTNDALDAVYFRQPVFLRESAVAQCSAAEGLARAHWACFVRSLLVFDRARWVNFPGSTYLAEHKAVQLACAAEVGFRVPRTAFTNSAEALPRIIGDAPDVSETARRVAVKGIDTVLSRDGDREIFGYTSLLSPEELSRHDLSSMPFAMQEVLAPKLDLRVTVVADACWSAEIRADRTEIDGDWRLHKDNVTYTPHALPAETAQRCVAITRRLGLTFGAIDLALVGGDYVFIEINPTGEWAWLEEACGFPISDAIADALHGDPSASIAGRGRP